MTHNFRTAIASNAKQSRMPAALAARIATSLHFLQ